MAFQEDPSGSSFFVVYAISQAMYSTTLPQTGSSCIKLSGTMVSCTTLPQTIVSHTTFYTKKKQTYNGLLSVIISCYPANNNIDSHYCTGTCCLTALFFPNSKGNSFAETLPHRRHWCLIQAISDHMPKCNHSE